MDRNLNEAEQIFFHLLDDERLFNSAKFKKALQQQKSRRVDDYHANCRL